jgi:hypothetical protein
MTSLPGYRYRITSQGDKAYRAQLNAEEKREAIVAYIDRAPQASNREVAKTFGFSDPGEATSGRI